RIARWLGDRRRWRDNMQTYTNINHANELWDEVLKFGSPSLRLRLLEISRSRGALSETRDNVELLTEFAQAMENRLFGRRGGRINGKTAGEEAVRLPSNLQAEEVDEVYRLRDQLRSALIAESGMEKD